MPYDPNSVALPPPDVYPPLENANLLANPGQPQVEVNPPTVGQFGQPSFGAVGGIPYLFGGVNPPSYDRTPTNYAGANPSAPGFNAPGYGRAIPGALLAGGGAALGNPIMAGKGAFSAINAIIKAYRARNSGNSQNMRGANDAVVGQSSSSPLLSGLFGNLFSGGPINQANWQTYNTPGPSGYSPRQLNLARSGADISQMNTQAQLGFGSNFTGNTQDSGHDIFNTGPGSHFAGRIVDGVLTRVPNQQINRQQFQSEAFGNFADPATWAAHGAQPYPSQTPAIDPALAASLGFMTSPPPIASLPPSPAGYGGLM